MNKPSSFPASLVAASLITSPAIASKAASQPPTPERAAIEVCENLFQRENYPKEVRTFGGAMSGARYVLQASTADGQASIECEYYHELPDSKMPPLSAEVTVAEEEELKAKFEYIRTELRQKGRTFVLETFLPILEKGLVYPGKIAALKGIQDDEQLFEATAQEFVLIERSLLFYQIEKDISAGRRKIKKAVLRIIFLGREHEHYEDTSTLNSVTGVIEAAGADGIVDLVRRTIKGKSKRTWEEVGGRSLKGKRRHRFSKKEYDLQSSFGALARIVRDAQREGRLVPPGDPQFKLHAGFWKKR